MSWSRDLGIVNAEDVPSAIAGVTARMRGVLDPEASMRLSAYRERLASGGVMTAAEVADMSKLNEVSVPTSTPEELATIAKAEAIATEAVKLMGGEAHVHLGASSFVDQQPESPLKGRRQTSITVTVTVTTDEWHLSQRLMSPSFELGSRESTSHSGHNNIALTNSFVLRWWTISSGMGSVANPMTSWSVAYNRMLSVVMPNHVIDPHVDAQPLEWITRVHVPLVTNEQAVTITNNKRYHLEVGKAYLVNTRIEHAVRNDGTTPRIHFMFDVRREGA
jgi:aspartyl/asparaginyl beta-hydroxylase